MSYLFRFYNDEEFILFFFFLYNYLLYEDIFIVEKLLDLVCKKSQ